MGKLKYLRMNIHSQVQQGSQGKHSASSAWGLRKGQLRTSKPPGCPSFLPAVVCQDRFQPEAWRGCGGAVNVALWWAAPAGHSPQHRLALTTLEHKDTVLRRPASHSNFHWLLKTAGWSPSLTAELSNWRGELSDRILYRLSRCPSQAKPS